jgi:hypothetical protein
MPGENTNNRTPVVRSKIAAIRDYLIEQSDGSALCKICRVRFGKKTSTSTITRHFDARHHNTYLAVTQRVLDIQHFQPYGRKDQIKVNNIDNKLTHWLVADQMAFMLMDSGWFKAFIRSLNERYTLPCRQTIAKRVSDAFNNRRIQLQPYLIQQPGKFSLTTDIWSACNMVSYLGITIHWVNTEWQMQILLLDIVLLHDAHTAENITDTICNILCDFVIGDRLLSITTDNGANMVKMGHLLHNKIEQQFENPNVIYLHCVAHILNLGVHVGLQKISSEVKKARTFSSKLRNSPLLLEDMKKIARSLEEDFKMPETDVPTRWNSTYLMLRRFEKIKTITDILVTKHQNLQDVYLTHTERDILEVS